VLHILSPSASLRRSYATTASVRSPGPAALYVARPLPEGARIVLRALRRSLNLLVLRDRLSISHAPMLYPSEPSHKPLYRSALLMA
jgi:hypothetical protein